MTDDQELNLEPVDPRTLPQEDFEPTFKRTQETANLDPTTNTATKEWQAVRDECVAGDSLDERCNIISASLGNGRLEVVAKRLACGCILIPVDSEEIAL